MIKNAQTEPAGVTVQNLEIKNFLGIKELKISPDGKFNFITGRNGAGKTSILKAIQFAFEGKERGKEDADYIFNGEDKAEILLDMGKFQINRRITENGNYVDVLKDGFKAQSPSKQLKEMVGKNFNPIDFAFCDKKERNQIVLKALGVEYTTKKAAEDGVYDEELLKDDNGFNNLNGLELVEKLIDMHYSKRTEVNKFVDVAEKSILGLKKELPDDITPFNKDEYDKVLKEIKDGENVLRTEEKDLKIYEQSEFEVKRFISGIKEIMTTYGDGEVHCKIDLISNKIETQKAGIEKTKKAIENRKEKELKLRNSMEFLQVQTQIKEFEERIPKGEKLSKELKEKIEKLRGSIKQRLIEESDIGIAGLSFDGGVFKVNDVPVENLSDSEKLRLGVKIAEKISGALDFVFIDGVERMDPETLKEFTKDLESSSFQYFFTTCHNVEDVGQRIEIENGEIKN